MAGARLARPTTAVDDGVMVRAEIAALRQRLMMAARRVFDFADVRQRLMTERFHGDWKQGSRAAAKEVCTQKNRG
jgi:hypothetical protein